MKQKIPEENAGKYLCNLRLREAFLIMGEEKGRGGKSVQSLIKVFF
jgi:hypothetical protein